MISGKSIFHKLERIIQGDAGKLTLARGEPPFDHCPVCFYSLSELPTAPSCPKCGFGCDENTKVWERLVRTPREAAVACLMTIIAVPTLLFCAIAIDTQKQFAGWFAFLLGSTLYSWLARLTVQKARVPRLFAINSQGLWVRHFRRREYHFDWQQVAKIRWEVIFHKWPKNIQSLREFLDQWYTGTRKPGIIRDAIWMATSSEKERDEIKSAIEFGLAQNHKAKQTHNTKCAE